MNQDVEKLYDEALGEIDNGNFDSAIKLGRRLIELRHSSGFEVIAQAYRAQDDFEKALEILREGVATAPAAWGLWLMLGSTLSDLERFDEAEQAYDSALDHQADRPAVEFNRAIIRARQGRKHEALDLLDANQPPLAEKDLWMQVQLAALRLLLELERPGDASARADSLTKRFKSADEDAQADFHALRATAIWQSRHDARSALDEAFLATTYNKLNDRALDLIRRIEDRRSPQARVFNLILHARANPFHKAKGAPKLKGFYTNYTVIAGSKEEAVALAARLEPEHVRSLLEISECNEGDACADEPSGVLSTSGYVMY